MQWRVKITSSKKGKFSNSQIYYDPCQDSDPDLDLHHVSDPELDPDLDSDPDSDPYLHPDPDLDSNFDHDLEPNTDRAMMMPLIQGIEISTAISIT